MSVNRRLYPADKLSNPDHLVRHCSNCQHCYIDETNDMVIYVDGACPGNGTPYARAGIGAFFHSDSPLNVSAPLSTITGSSGGGGPQTNQRAEICAAIAALQIVKKLHLEHFFCCGVDGVVLISDSAYLVKAVTGWIDKWSKNGWMNASGRPVVNREDFLKLEGLLGYLEKHRLRVRFWHVDRKFNVLGDRLAREGVDAKGL